MIFIIIIIFLHAFDDKIDIIKEREREKKNVGLEATLPNFHEKLPILRFAIFYFTIARFIIFAVPKQLSKDGIVGPNYETNILIRISVIADERRMKNSH